MGIVKSAAYLEYGRNVVNIVLPSGSKFSFLTIKSGIEIMKRLLESNIISKEEFMFLKNELEGPDMDIEDLDTEDCHIDIPYDLEMMSARTGLPISVLKVVEDKIMESFTNEDLNSFKKMENELLN